jgi:ferredoxin-NADP reductase
LAGDNKTWRVKRTQRESEDVTSVFLESPDKDRFRGRMPGQFATIRIMGEDGWSEPHPFTISCSPEDEDLRLTIKRAGGFTRAIHNIEPGAEVRFQGPFGAFLKDVDEQEEIVFIAGGVGVTPFLSALRHFRNIGADNRVTLFWANRTLDDAFGREELEEMTREIDLRVIHVLSRAEPPAHSEAGGKVRFESGHITRDILQKHTVSPTASFYLCGPPGMQEFVLEELKHCGVDKEKVRREGFGYGGGK